MKSVLSLTLALLFLSGCVTASVTKLSNSAYEATLPEDVTIYLDASDIPGEYEKIAIINTKGESSMTNERQMFEKARREAAKLGANGVLISRVQEPSAGAKVAGAFLGTGAQRAGEMIAIHVTPHPQN